MMMLEMQAEWDAREAAKAAEEGKSRTGVKEAAMGKFYSDGFLSADQTWKSTDELPH